MFGLRVREVRVAHPPHVGTSVPPPSLNALGAGSGSILINSWDLGSVDVPLHLGPEPPAVGTSHACANGGLRLFVWGGGVGVRG